MKHFYLLLFSALFLTSCFRLGSGGGGGQIIVSASETDIDRKKKKRTRSNAGSGIKCFEDRRCAQSCEDVYDEDDEDEWKVETCGNKRYNIAIHFEDIDEILDDPAVASLREIDERAFDTFMDISVKPWVEATERITEKTAKIFLSWVASKSKISQAIQKGYNTDIRETEFDKYEGMNNLFEEIEPAEKSSYFSSTNQRKCAQYCGAITEKAIVGTTTSYWDIALERGNEVAQALACEIAEQECEDLGPDAFDPTDPQSNQIPTECRPLMSTSIFNCL